VPRFYYYYYHHNNDRVARARIVVINGYGRIERLSVKNKIRRNVRVYLLVARIIPDRNMVFAESARRFDESVAFRRSIILTRATIIVHYLRFYVRRNFGTFLSPLTDDVFQKRRVHVTQIVENRYECVCLWSTGGGQHILNTTR